ncbi:hypothetical protein CPK_ORF00497 [Chlamydia pneumoniae LPCoLN]|uniref:hypothetical protein n=1 Tax=Chlamydia pneumoniae TaxID=83558 RepID=UPI0001BD9E79|nr:hypothetical protein [Chlamydia pneumoniae]ACZ32972.1 hypothetical protein CPK_ORF00497 [Chlamydia pneumoniae LPCoLN]ETR79863.1 hypothetical protein X556_0804 [Chlamydia pneumoniae B21]
MTKVWQKQLEKSQVTNLKTGDFSALGPFSHLLVKMLNAFSYLHQKAPLQHTSEEICYTGPKFRDICRFIDVSDWLLPCKYR